MKFCTKCGKEIHDEAVICIHCGNQASEANSAPKAAQKYSKEPKCTYCGHIGPWIIGPVFRWWDWVAGGVFALFGVFPGIIYLAVVGLIRSNVNNREKKCAKCGAQNLFTFQY